MKSNKNIAQDSPELYGVQLKPYDIMCCVPLQLPLPDESVDERNRHSVSTLQLGPHCMWLILFGGADFKANTVIIELSEY